MKLWAIIIGVIIGIVGLVLSFSSQDNIGSVLSWLGLFLMIYGTITGRRNVKHSN